MLIKSFKFFSSVHGPYLFSYICKNKEYTETTVQFFMKQLLTAVNWIHGQNLLHLDLKVSAYGLEKRIGENR